MGQKNVSSAVLQRLSSELDDLTPEAQKAARYVLENPRDVGVSTVREIADAADVKPNTVVRMARQVGFDGYDDFREPFREAIRQGQASLPDRAGRRAQVPHAALHEGQVSGQPRVPEQRHQRAALV